MFVGCINIPRKAWSLVNNKENKVGTQAVFFNKHLLLKICDSVYHD